MKKRIEIDSMVFDKIQEHLFNFYFDKRIDRSLYKKFLDDLEESDANNSVNLIMSAVIWRIERETL
jgi:hypothetical protein